jgi:hypothetical protein
MYMVCIYIAPMCECLFRLLCILHRFVGVCSVTVAFFMSNTVSLSITVYSNAGIQCSFTREGKRGVKADRHAADLGKQMPTANTLTFGPGEEITEISVIVSGTQLPGVIGQMCIKTNLCPEGYKFGRTTDGEELSLFTPDGLRALCFHGRCVVLLCLSPSSVSLSLLCMCVAVCASMVGVLSLSLSLSVFLSLSLYMCVTVCFLCMCVTVCVVSLSIYLSLSLSLSVHIHYVYITFILLCLCL